MNSLSLVLVIAIAFVSYSQGNPENCASSPSETDTKNAVDPSGYVDGYEISYGNITKNGYADISLKLHMSPHGGVQKGSLPLKKILCGAMCAIQCISGQNTASCLSCMAGCVV